VEKSDHLSPAVSMAACAVAGWPSAAAPVSLASWCRPTVHSFLHFPSNFHHFPYIFSAFLRIWLQFSNTKVTFHAFAPVYKRTHNQTFVCGLKSGQQWCSARVILAFHDTIAIPTNRLELRQHQKIHGQVFLVWRPFARACGVCVRHFSVRSHRIYHTHDTKTKSARKTHQKLPRKSCSGWPGKWRRETNAQDCSRRPIRDFERADSYELQHPGTISCVCFSKNDFHRESSVSVFAVSVLLFCVREIVREAR
jgi:hypothetical protein